ncbi:efflux RND transporter periplasmic adaptor subunit [Halomonas ventosae]|uniref:Membrane fusion protein (Multidrug efflux system) n=1 Tax=Halomonas ventosae TaxID=229007 RepID=A0A4R6I4C7_9GAMM|nr:efflux RND transporter periplasmic adaptor subunit [Halomonas ventosae]TDO16502.1 membrane fusion protein (multidrug efflux system) [Halomonas ventosae]
MIPSRPRLLLLGLAALMFAPLLAAQQPTAVIAARVSLAAWSDPLEALGTLHADESVTLSATVTDTIRELNFRDGETVTAGQLLVRLADDEAQADVRAAQALRDERRNAVNRLAQLQDRNLAPRADVEDAWARLRQAEAQVQALEARLADYRIYAPFNGVVGFRNLSVGALVSPGTALVTLDKLDIMKLDFTLPERALGQVTPGLPLTAVSDAFPDASFAGEIATIGARIDPVSRSIMVRAVLDNPELRLRPGMLMRVVVERAPRETLVMPESALIPQGERQFVLVLDESDQYRVDRRQVVIGARREGEVEVLEGLEAGELVVAHGTERVRDGQPTRLLGILDDDTSIPELLRRGRGDAADNG